MKPSWTNLRRATGRRLRQAVGAGRRLASPPLRRAGHKALVEATAALSLLDDALRYACSLDESAALQKRGATNSPPLLQRDDAPGGAHALCRQRRWWRHWCIQTMADLADRSWRLAHSAQPCDRSPEAWRRWADAERLLKAAAQQLQGTDPSTAGLCAEAAEVAGKWAQHLRACLHWVMPYDDENESDSTELRDELGGWRPSFPGAWRLLKSYDWPISHRGEWGAKSFSRGDTLLEMAVRGARVLMRSETAPQNQLNPLIILQFAAFEEHGLAAFLGGPWSGFWGANEPRPLRTYAIPLGDAELFRSPDFKELAVRNAISARVRKPHSKWGLLQTTHWPRQGAPRDDLADPPAKLEHGHTSLILHGHALTAEGGAAPGASLLESLPSDQSFHAALRAFAYARGDIAPPEDAQHLNHEGGFDITLLAGPDADPVLVDANGEPMDIWRALDPDAAAHHDMELDEGFDMPPPDAGDAPAGGAGGAGKGAKSAGRVNGAVDGKRTRIDLRKGLAASPTSDVQEWIRRLNDKPMSEAARAETLRVLADLRGRPAAASKAHRFLRLVEELPWTEAAQGCAGLDAAAEALGRSHVGLDTVKDRILDVVAADLRHSGQPQAICLVGAPGVGKTTVAKSIAEAMGRPFERFSCAGVGWDVELRGNSRLWESARPGGIIKCMQRAGVTNPVILLDEIDKAGAKRFGDSLLELLDPAQNAEFRDHFLDFPYDLSQVAFIATANDLSHMSRPLLDRLEVIELRSYRRDEKESIARECLLPKIRAALNLDEDQFALTPDGLKHLVEHRSSEAGVRKLEEALRRLGRKCARYIATEQENPPPLDAERITEWLGPAAEPDDAADGPWPAGAALGLAVNGMGGAVLRIEAALTGPANDIKITGRMGDVMKESVMAARLGAERFLDAQGEQDALSALRKQGLHVHAPAGGVQKDGPSAGVALCAAIVSAACGRPVRKTIAMTGEVTLSGAVLQVGGIAEKASAAMDAGLRILLPQGNHAECKDLPQDTLDRTKPVLVSTVAEALQHLFEPSEEQAAE